MKTLMVVTTFLSILCLPFLNTTTYAQWGVSELWVQEYTDAPLYGCAYNPVTDHVILAAGLTAPIMNASDGTPTGSSLQLPTDSGTLFAISCAEDGVIFLYDFNRVRIYRYATESSTPDIVTPSGLMVGIRCMRAYGSGPATQLYITGGDENDKIQLMTPEGASWSVRDLIPPPAAKSGVFSNPPLCNRVFGIQPFVSDYDPTNAIPDQRQGWPRRFDFIGSTWIVSTSFIPEDPTPDNHISYCVGGDYIPDDYGRPGLAFIFYYNNAMFWGLDEETGSKIIEYQVPGYCSYYANAHVDPAHKRIYYGVRRSGIEGPDSFIDQGVYGCLSYTSPPPPAAVSANWQLYQ
jgi:hypothetical protein